MNPTTPSTSRRWLRKIGLWALLLIIVVLGGSALSNLLLPSRSDVVDRLSALDKAQIAEVVHLRHIFGDSLWAGWGVAEIPLIVYNEEYAFLVGCDDPSPGWTTVPRGDHHGGLWEKVPGDTMGGRCYYRQRIFVNGPTPQAFTVRVGERWVGSMTTKEWTVIKMGNEVRDGLPPVLRIVVPYRLAGRFFAGLTLNTDAYICAMAHESVHAYQGIVAPTRLADAEIALGRDGDRYPWENRTLHDGWKTELDALAAALSEQDEKRTIELSRKFISTRRARRLSRDLDTSLVNLERLREWEEGLAKYTELAIWKLASTDSTYRPILDLRSDPDFMDYKGFRQQWMQEVTTLRLQSGAGETRFYYSGMAQAFLLDRLLPDWRMRGLREGGSLEDLLSEAVDTGR